MKLLRIVPAIVLILWSCSHASAQAELETISKTFRITWVTHMKTRDTALAYLPNTPRSGISLGATAVVYTVSTSGSYTAEIGTGFVASCSDTGTYIYVISNIKARTDSNYMVKEGDLVTLNIKIPAADYRSIFFDLETAGVEFYKRDNDPLCDFESLLQRDSPKTTDSLLEVCVQECRKEFQRLTAQEEIAEAYTQPLSAGRHRGKTILDVLKNATKPDVLPFLLYASENPDDFKGHRYYLSYAQAMWLYMNSPFSATEMLDTLTALQQQPKKFAERVNAHKASITENDFISKWVFRAFNYQNNGDLQKAEKTLGLLHATAKILGDDFSLGMAYLCHAQINQKKSNFQAAIRYCDSAARHFKPNVQGFYHVELLIKKGFCYKALENLDESVRSFEKALTVINDPATEYGYNSRNSNSARVYENIGDVYAEFGNFTKAVDAYKQSIHLYAMDSTYEKGLELARVQNALADVYKNQGAYQDAFEMYTELRSTYARISNINSAAFTLNDLGYVVFKQGKYEEAIGYHRNAENLYNYLERFGKAGFSVSQIGQAYWNLGNYDSAIISHRKAIAYASLDNSYEDLAYSYSKLGELYNIVGDKQKALAAYDSTSYFYIQAKDSAGLIRNLLDVGDVYEADGQFQRAFDYYSNAHQLNLRRNNKSELVNSYFKMAYAAYKFDTAVARNNYLACYRLAKEIGDKSNLLYAALNLGLLCTRSYDYNDAERYFNEGILLSIENNSKADEAYAYEFIGYSKQQKLEFDAAIHSFQTALRIYDSLGQKTKLPNLYVNIGNCVQSKGEFEQAIRYYEQSRSIAAAVRNLADVANALHYLSFAYALSGEPQKSLEAADSSLSIYTGLNNTWQMANSYLGLGNAYHGMSDYKKSVEYYLKADSLYVLEKDDWSSGTAMNNIGSVYYHQADYDKALDYFLRADKLYRKLKTINESVLLTTVNIGETYFALKNYAKAKEYLLNAFKRSSEKSVARTYTGAGIVLAKIATEENQLAAAKNFLDSVQLPAYRLKEANKIIELHLAYGRLLAREGKEKESIVHLRTAVEHSIKTKTDKYLWQALYELGLAHYNHNRLDSAIACFKQAVEVVEAGASKLFGGAEARKIFTADLRKVDLYNKLVASLAKLNRTEEALFYADKSNSQAIKEKLEQSGIVTSDKEKSAALQKGNELLQKQTAIEQAIAKEKAKPEKERNNQLIASLESIRKVAEEDYLNFINQLVQDYKELQGYFAKTNPADFRNYIDYIPDSTIVVLYVINDKQLYIFTVTNQETAIRVVELREDINRQAYRLLSILKNPENATGTTGIQVRATIKSKDALKGDFKTEASSLYNLLITPVADQLAGKKNICIIPNAKLSSIPFATLGTMGDNGQFKFLIEDYCLFYTNKLDIFSKPHKQQAVNGALVAFGNPDKTLPGAALEVNNIKDLYPNTTVYLEDAATEERAKDALKSSRYVHFATHGVLDNSDFSNSFILFNGDGKNDGKFTLAEINGLIKGENDMIILSACDLAVSKDISSTGWEISVLNAFLNNRIRTGIAPLWQVPDEATTLLLTEFYKNLKTMSRSEALRHAQATLSRNPKYAHPYCWGAFVLYGEWR